MYWFCWRYFSNGMLNNEVIKCNKPFHRVADKSNGNENVQNYSYSTEVALLLCWKKFIRMTNRKSYWITIFFEMYYTLLSLKLKYLSLLTFEYYLKNYEKCFYLRMFFLRNNNKVLWTHLNKLLYVVKLSYEVIIRLIFLSGRGGGVFNFLGNNYQRNFLGINILVYILL